MTRDMLEAVRGESLLVRVRAVTPGGGVVRPAHGTSVIVLARPLGAVPEGTPEFGAFCTFDGARDWQGLLDTSSWEPGEWALKARVRVHGGSYPGGMVSADGHVTGEDGAVLMLLP